MDNKELKYLLTVANYHGLNAAAEKLYISAPTLSRYIKKREADLGYPIFIRNGKRFDLAASGKEYLHYLEQVQALRQSLDARLADQNLHPESEIKIGFQMNIGNLIISKLLPQLQAEFPGVRFYTSEEHLNKILPQLRNDDLDVVISFKHQHDLTDLAAVPLMTGTIVLAGPELPASIQPKQNPAFAYPWLDIQDMQKLALLGLRKNSYFNRILRNYFILEANALPQIQITLSTVNHVLLAAETGLGYATTLDAMLQLAASNNRFKEMRLYSFGPAPITDALALITKPENQDNPIIQRLLSLLRQNIAQQSNQI